MLTFRKLLLALTAVAAISAPALAQQQQTPRTFDGVMLYYPDTGRMVMARMDKKSIDMAMKQAKPINGPMMIIMQGGKAYMVENMMDKVPDGQRMIDYFEKRTYGNF